MDDRESLSEFYQRKFDFIPENFKNEIGHFNVFEHEPIEAGKSRPLPYKRRDFYKIMFVKGNIEMIYADRVIQIEKQALFFSNPHIPYTCGGLDRIEEGYYCIFNHHFFQHFGNLNQYSVFLPAGNHVFELTKEQADAIRSIYQKMKDEIESDYIHKYDVLRNLVFELLHFAMKTQPFAQLSKQPQNASKRIATLFLELLERQFPIDENHAIISVRSASDFANQLNVHVNHLNRAVKETCGKTTTNMIAERLIQEAKIMLKQSKWNISEIAYSLGFLEVTHFNNFFKKQTDISPSKFRQFG
jgi:AraC family transcriptional regulator, transcriptional activator of pobA